MANPNGPPPQYRFKPGNPGGGRPKGLLRKDQVQAVMGRFSQMTRAQLHAVVQDPKSTMLEITVAAIYVRAAKDGDPSRMSFLLERMIGKVKDELHVKTGDDIDELDQRRQMALEMLGDPEAFEAAALLAERVSDRQVKRDHDQRTTERAERTAAEQDEPGPSEAR